MRHSVALIHKDKHTPLHHLGLRGDHATNADQLVKSMLFPHARERRIRMIEKRLSWCQLPRRRAGGRNISMLQISRFIFPLMLHAAPVEVIE